MGWGLAPPQENSVKNVCLPEYTYNHASKFRTPKVNLPRLCFCRRSIILSLNIDSKTGKGNR